jgi:hypothetical protein
LSCPKVAERLGVPFGTAKMWIWADSQTWEKRKAQRSGDAKPPRRGSTLWNTRS